jgi:hypothetical protein
MTERECPSCGRKVRLSAAVVASCGACWQRLPGHLRTAYLRAWGRLRHGTAGAAEEQQAAQEAILAWFGGHPR